MKAINRVECRDNGALIQVSSKVEVERVIMKENETRFKLAYLSSMINSHIHTDIGISGE